MVSSDTDGIYGTYVPGGTGEYSMLRDWGIYALVIVGTVILACINTPAKSVLDSNNPVILVPLGIVLLVLIIIVAYFKSIAPRRRLHEEVN